MKKIIFILLINLFVISCSTKNENKNEELSTVLDRMERMAIKAGKNISKGSNFLIKSSVWKSSDLLRFHDKIFKGQVKPANIILLGSYCEFSTERECADILLFLDQSDNPDLLLDVTRKKILNKN